MMLYVGIVFFGFILCGICWTSWIYKFVFHQNQEFSAIISINISAIIIYLSFWDSIAMNIRLFDIVPQVSEVLFIIFKTFLLLFK